LNQGATFFVIYLTYEYWFLLVKLFAFDTRQPQNFVLWIKAKPGHFFIIVFIFYFFFLTIGVCWQPDPIDHSGWKGLWLRLI
jgi:hypothetical protein